MDLSTNYSRLKQAHTQAISNVNHQVEHWKKIKNDYVQLSNLLLTLPDKTFHNVMVPFGSLAFMPGKLIHTNELMVHLGDSWFADVSCKEGLKIIDHRLESVNKNLEDLDKVLKNIEKKTDFAEELDNSGECPAFEIKEELPSSYIHPGKRKRISRVTTKPANEKSKTQNQKSGKVPVPIDQEAMKSCFNDEELMKRLDELEREEEQQDQLLFNESTPSTNLEEKTSTFSQVKSHRKVTWKTKIMEGKDADSDDSDDIISSSATIRFQHTPSMQDQRSERVSNGENLSDEVTIKTPADIGRFSSISSKGSSAKSVGVIELENTNPQSSNPKSILKPSTSKAGLEAEKFTKPRADMIPHQLNPVSESVMERGSQQLLKQEEKQEPKKPVSKFKASRRR